MSSGLMVSDIHPPQYLSFTPHHILASLVAWDISLSAALDAEVIWPQTVWVCLGQHPADGKTPTQVNVLVKATMFSVRYSIMPTCKHISIRNQLVNGKKNKRLCSQHGMQLTCESAYTSTKHYCFENETCYNFF